IDECFLSEIIKHGDEVMEFLNCREDKKNMFYVVTERHKASGGLSSKYQQMILDGLYCLDKLMPGNVHEGLENFKESFLKKFENNEVPLLHALDPEVGVGYENLEKTSDQNSLLK